MKKLLKLSLILSALMLIIFSGCKKDDEATTVDKFTFLALNHNWKYASGTFGTVEDTIDFITLYHAGGGIFNVEIDGSGSFWYQIDNTFGFYDEDYSKKIPVCKTDAKANDTYTTIIDGDTLKYKVLRLNVNTVVPAGSFSCYEVYSYYNSEIDGIFYINKTAGIIKYESPTGEFFKLLSKNF